MRRATVFLALLLYPVGVLPQEQLTITGMYFTSLQKFLEAPDDIRLPYSAGFLEGLGVASLMGAPNESLSLLYACVKRMNPSQISAIFTKYGRDNPAVWHNPFGTAAVDALSDACPDFKTWNKRHP